MSIFKRVVRFCFVHERVRIENGSYLNLEVGTLHRLSGVGIPCQHEACDICQESERRKETQPSLFEEG